MVMVRFGTPFAEINGKVGNIRYRRDQCQFHIEELPHKFREPTLWQGVDRAAFLRAVRKWKQFLQPEYSLEYTQWEIWSNHHPQKNKKGETYYLSVYGAFMSVNIDRFLSGLPLSFSPYGDFGPQLSLPGIWYYQVNPILARATLTFTRAMLTTSSYTPDVKDFVLSSSLHGSFNPQNVYWKTPWILHLEWYNVGFLKNWYSFRYRRGKSPLSTLYPKFYHSFKLSNWYTE